MVNLRRQYLPVDRERRKDTRVEFHYPVVVLGIDDHAQILDFSLNGFHIEIQTQDDLSVGQIINLAVRLPMERDTLRIRAKVAYKDQNGIGCRFVDLGPANQEKLERCFNVINSTLPIE